MAGQLVAIQAFDSNGVPAAGAKFYTYAAGTTTPKAAYSDEAGTIALSNPVVCNAAGIAACYLKSGIGDYKIALKDSTGAVFLFRTIDNYTPDTDSILYIIGSDIETARTEALDAAEAAQLAQSLAETAQAAAEAAQLAAENAETGAQSAQVAAEAAQTGVAASAAAAAASATAAQTARTAAELAETNAETAEVAAELAETNAEAAQALAEAAAAATEGSAATAAASATAAAASATAADASADSALAYAALSAESAGVAAQSIFGTVVIVKSRTTTAQPGSPANLDTYIIPAAATGAAWSTYNQHDIARYYTDGAAWVRITPIEGALAYCQDTNEAARFDGSSWADDSAALTTIEGGALPSGVIASQAQAEAGVENTKGMTSLRVAQAIDAQAPPETIASQAEAEAGSENTKMMTALRSAQAIAANILDEDAFTTDSATKAPSQQSVGAYIKTRGTIPQSIPATGVAGTADAITLTVAGGPALADGLSFLFQPEAANTGNVTINYNSGGAVQLLDGEGAALAVNDLKTTAPIIIRYDNAAAKWRLVSGGGSSASSVFEVDDYCVGDGSTDDSAGFDALADAVVANGGGVINFGFNKTYNVFNTLPNSTTSNLMVFTSAVDGLTINFNGSQIRSTATITNGQGQVLRVLQFTGSKNVTINGYDYDQATKTLNSNEGAIGIYLVDAVRYITINGARQNGGRSFLEVVRSGSFSATERGRQITINGADIANVFYGLSRQRNGDHFYAYGIRTRNMGRSEFPYNVSHQVVYLNSDGSGGAYDDVLFGVFAESGDAGQEGANIFSDYELHYVNHAAGGTTATSLIDMMVTQGSGSAAAGTIRNVRIFADIANGGANAQPVGFRTTKRLNNGTADTTTSRGHVVEGVVISGSFNGYSATPKPIDIGNYGDWTGETINMSLENIKATGTSATLVNAQATGVLNIRNVKSAGALTITNDAAGKVVLQGGVSFSNVSGPEASEIPIADAGGYFTTDNVEAALQQLGAAGGGGNSFGTIAVSGQSNVVADAANDTLTLVAGSNVTITTDAGTDTVTIASTAGSAAVTKEVKAYLNASQTGISSNTWTLVDIDTETYDSDSTFASDRWTPGAAGIVLIKAGVNYGGGLVDGEFAQIGIRKNGVLMGGSEAVRAVNSADVTFTAVYLQTVVFDICDSDDYYELWFRASGTGSKTLSANTNTTFQAVLLPQ